MRPGPGWSLLVIAGVAVGVLTRLDGGLAIAAAIGAVSAAIAPWPRRVLEIVLAAALVAASAAYGVHARDQALTSSLASWVTARAGAAHDVRDSDPVLVRGRLDRDATMSATGASLGIAVEGVRASGEWRPLSGHVQVTVGGQIPAQFARRATAGRAIVAQAFLRPVPMLSNPGDPDPRWTLLRRRVDALGSIKSASLVDFAPGGVFDEAAARVRDYVRRVVNDTIAPRSPQSAGIVIAILIGDQSGLDEALVRRLQIAGTYHVIAISGGNIAILTAVCLVVLRLFIRSWRLVSLVTLVVVMAYGFVVGGEPSVERAVMAASVYLLLELTGLRAPALTTLCVAGGVVALIDPLAVVDVGAWLSFGATLGIIVGATEMVAWATGGRTPGSMLDRLWFASLGLLAATVTAEVTLLPVSAAVFGRVSVAGLVLNFVAIPAMSIAQVAGTALVIVHSVSLPAARLAACLADAGARGLAESARVVDVVPELAWRTPSSGLWWSVAYYAAAAGALRLTRWRWPRRAAIGAWILSALVIATSFGTERARPSAGWLRLSLLDVGQGDSILVQFPTRQSLLVDAGGVPGSFDIGGRVVTPAIWALGERRLDWTEFTHPDNDHIGGVRSVLENLAPREIWEGVPVVRDAKWRALRLAADRRGVVWRQVLSGQTFQVGGVLVEVINPPAPDWERQKTRNDDSVAMRLRFGDVECILTGDMGQEVEDRWPSEAGAPPLRILKVPHHGSLSASTPAFVERVHPDVALISVGAGNLFGHPAPDVLARYTQIGAQIFRTDRDGAILVETNGEVVNIRTMRGRTFTLRSERAQGGPR